MNLKIALGSDHRGFETKRQLVQILDDLGREFEDFGTHSDTSCDYPDFAQSVALQVQSGGAARGILICGTGIGMAMAANKFGGVRAACCCDLHEAEMSRRHNDANILCLSADRLQSNNQPQYLSQLVRLWLSTEFEGGRHQRRVDKIDKPIRANSCHD